MRRRLVGVGVILSAWSLSCVPAQPLPSRLDSAACLQLPLTSPDPDTRERAARDLYLRCDRAVIASSKVVADGLIAAVRAGGTSSAMPILLLGHVPAGRAELSALLKAKHGQMMVKLESWNKPVASSVAAAVGLSRLGDAEGIRLLKQQATQKDLAVREFLLDAAGELPDASLSLLRPYLDDKREITSGVPSGAGPRRRLCDAAVVAFARRLPLKVQFAIGESRRFTDAELASARDGVDASLKPGPR